MTNIVVAKISFEFHVTHRCQFLLSVTDILFTVEELHSIIRITKLSLSLSPSKHAVFGNLQFQFRPQSMKRS